MGIANQQNIPEKPKEGEAWTFKKLFQISDIVKTVTKVFVTPFDYLFSFFVIVAGINELLGHEVSLGAYLLAIVILAASLFERHINLFITEKQVKKIKK